MDTPDSIAIHTQHKRTPRWDRLHVAHVLQQFDDAPPEFSQRQFAEQNDVPRTTLQAWLARREQINLPPELVRFLESPQGVQYLHRMLIALHLVFVHHAGCGVRKVSEFLHLTGLDQVVAPSPTSQQQFCQTVSQEIVAFGEHQQHQLAADMPRREIAVCEDETYHPQICLVAIEPVSGFILLEEYVDRRDAETWKNNLEEATEGLPVEIAQIVSDEAQGIVAQANQHDAHHSPDLFHIQQELCWATSASLARQTRQAEEALEQAHHEAQQRTALAEACQTQCPESSVNAELAGDAEQAAQHVQQAQQDLEACQQRQEQAQQARQGVSDAYHPWNLSSGEAQQAEQVQQQLNEKFDTLEHVAHEAGLSSTCHERIAKARRLVVKMVATIVFFWRTVYRQLEAFSLAPELERSLLEEVLPAKYLALAAAKASTAERRRELQEAAIRLSNLARDGPLQDLPEAERLALEDQAAQWAALFQRSSSCVEGRNGQLSLWHHSLHRLNPLRLAALTVLHNYYLCRADGTTAAERFFGTAPDSLLDWLAAHVPYPSRPAPRKQAA